MEGAADVAVIAVMNDTMIVAEVHLVTTEVVRHATTGEDVETEVEAETGGDDLQLGKELFAALNIDVQLPLKINYIQ